MLTFSVLDQKNPFWANLVKKIEIVNLSGNSVPRLIWMMMFTFSVFDRKYLFGQIWSKKSNQTRLIWICRIMQKICGVHFFCFGREKPFLGKSYKKNQNCQFKLKLGTKTNLNMRNSLMMFTFSVFGHKCLSWANLVHLNTMVLTNFEVLNSISSMFQETHNLLVLSDAVIVCIYLRTTDIHFRE